MTTCFRRREEKGEMEKAGITSVVKIECVTGKARTQEVTREQKEEDEATGSFDL